MNKYKLCAVACIDENRGIGFNNKLLYHSKRDMKFFKELTTDGVVVMGGNTFRSLPNKLPLKNRTNVILSTSIQDTHDNMIICEDMDSLYKTINKLLQYSNVYIIGGESLYNEFQLQFDELYITHILKKFENVDTYFPDIIDFNYDSAEIIDSWNEESIKLRINHYFEKGETS